MDRREKLSVTTITLHWLIAIGIMFLIGMGLYMVKTEAWNLFDIHKSIGLLLFALIIVRVIWRIRNGLPEPVAEVSPLMRKATKAAHWLLLAFMLMLPITGMLYSGASGYGFGIFEMSLFPSRYDAKGDPIPYSPAVSDWGQRAHDLLGYFLAVLVVLHVAAALKHHLWDKDDTLKRMLGMRRGE